MAINQNEYIHAMAEDPETGKPMQKVKVEGLESNSIQPTELQSRYATTIQTHSGTVVAPAGNGIGTWIDCDGFDRVAITFSCGTAPTANDKLYINVDWSNDGATPHGLDVMPVKIPINLVRAAGILDVKARWCRLTVVNVDTPPHTVNSYAYLKA